MSQFGGQFTKTTFDKTTAASPVYLSWLIIVRLDVLLHVVIADHYHRFGYTLIELWALSCNEYSTGAIPGGDGRDRHRSQL
jgi:hypothetical protein